MRKILDPAAKWVYDIYKEAMMTRLEFSLHCGVSLGQVGDWFSGRAKPNINSLRKVAITFGVEPPQEVIECAQRRGGPTTPKPKAKTWHYDGHDMEFCQRKTCEWRSPDRKCHMPACMKGR